MWGRQEYARVPDGAGALPLTSLFDPCHWRLGCPGVWGVDWGWCGTWADGPPPGGVSYRGALSLHPLGNFCLRASV